MAEGIVMLTVAVTVLVAAEEDFLAGVPEVEDAETSSGNCEQNVLTTETHKAPKHG